MNDNPVFTDSDELKVKARHFGNSRPARYRSSRRSFGNDAWTAFLSDTGRHVQRLEYGRSFRPTLELEVDRELPADSPTLPFRKPKRRNRVCRLDNQPNNQPNNQFDNQFDNQPDRHHDRHRVPAYR